MVTIGSFFKVHLPQYLDIIADLKKALVTSLYPNSPIYNYMTGDKMDTIIILSAASRQQQSILDKLHYTGSHLRILHGQEYILQLYKANGDQYTLADYEAGQVEYPPPMTTHNTEDDNEDSDDIDKQMATANKRRKYY